jgi:CRP-like cAMP-binding protein
VFGKDTKIERLRKVPLFADCSKRELAEIAAVADELRFPPRREVIREGAAGRELVVVLSGDVEVTRGGELVAEERGANFFGEAALLTGAPRNATVTTTSEVEALVLTDRAFTRLLERSPEIERKVQASLEDRVPQD